MHSATDGTPAAPCTGALPAPRLQLIRLDCAAWKVQIRCRSLHISHNYVHRSFGMQMFFCSSQTERGLVCAWSGHRCMRGSAAYVTVF